MRPQSREGKIARDPILENGIAVHRRMLITTCGFWGNWESWWPAHQAHSDDAVLVLAWMTIDQNIPLRWATPPDTTCRRALVVIHAPWRCELQTIAARTCFETSMHHTTMFRRGDSLLNTQQSAERRRMHPATRASRWPCVLGDTGVQRTIA